METEALLDEIITFLGLPGNPTIGTKFVGELSDEELIKLAVRNTQVCSFTEVLGKVLGSEITTRGPKLQDQFEMKIMESITAILYLASKSA